MENKEWRLILKGQSNIQENYDCNVNLTKKSDGTFYYTITSLRWNPKLDGYVVIEYDHLLKEGSNLTVKDLKNKKYPISVINWFKTNLDLK